MRVLVVNCGSSTLKFQLIDTAREDTAPASERDLAHGAIERIGHQATLDFQAGSNAYRDTATIADHEEASRRVFAWLDTAGFLAPGGLDAVGHRVVHGGPLFVAPTRLDDNVIAALTQLRELAPLHNDPALPGFLARKEGVETAEVETWLNTRSGLLGVSEHSGDMRELLEAAGQGDAGAELAVVMFCYRVRKYIAAYLAVLNGADTIIFGGGIGENAPEVRARICAQMDWCGLRLDTARNTAAREAPARISTDDATLHV